MSGATLKCPSLKTIFQAHSEFFAPRQFPLLIFLLIVSPFSNINHFGGFCYKINETDMINVQLCSVHLEIAHIEPL